MAPFIASELRTDLEALSAVLLPAAPVDAIPSDVDTEEAATATSAPLAEEPTAAESMQIRAFIMLAHAAL